MSMDTVTIRIADDFSKTLGGRTRRRSDFSGEEFRTKHLIPALKRGVPVKVIMDGTTGYPSSFIDEAFGGLIREGLHIEHLREQLRVTAEDPDYKLYTELVWDAISSASAACQKAIEA